jgi:hypothetical protein
MQRKRDEDENEEWMETMSKAFGKEFGFEAHFVDGI